VSSFTLGPLLFRWDRVIEGLDFTRSKKEDTQ